MSSPNIYRDGSIAAQPFSSMLPTAVPNALQAVARKQAKGARSQQEIEAARELAKVEGYDEGFSQGIALGIAEGIEQAKEEALAKAYAEAQVENARVFAQFQQELATLMTRVETSLIEWCSRTEDELTALVTNICAQVIDTELQQSRESVLSIVREAMKQVTHSTNARVRVNPFDLETLNTHKAELLACGGSIRSLDISEDPTIYGGCVLETHGGVVDARVERRMLSLDNEIGDAA